MNFVRKDKARLPHLLPPHRLLLPQKRPPSQVEPLRPPPPHPCSRVVLFKQVPGLVHGPAVLPTNMELIRRLFLEVVQRAGSLNAMWKPQSVVAPVFLPPPRPVLFPEISKRRPVVPVWPVWSARRT